MPSRSSMVFLVGAVVALVSACGGKSGQSAGGAPAPSRGSTSTVAGDEMRPAPNEPIEKVLQGRISGVDVSTGPDGGLAVRIRGASSGGSSDPLYVIDGVAVQPGPGGSLSGLSPYDIESIKVLKDPAELTMYGSRGANGVIVIKTKKAKKR